MRTLWSDWAYNFTRSLKKEQQWFASVSTSSKDYFDVMIHYGIVMPSRPLMIRGLITSAGSGSEALMGTVRTALIGTLQAHRNHVLPFYVSLLEIMQNELPNGRLVKPGLEVLGFLLDFDSERNLHCCTSQYVR